MLSIVYMVIYCELCYCMHSMLSFWFLCSMEFVYQQVQAIEREIEIKVSTLDQEAKELRPLLSDEEYDQLLGQHRKELLELKNRLRRAMEKEKRAGAKDANIGDDKSSEDRVAAVVQRLIDSKHVEVKLDLKC